MNAGSCPAVQFRVNYKNGGIFIVQHVMVMDLRLTGQSFTPQPANPLREMLVHIPKLNRILAMYEIFAWAHVLFRLCKKV